MSELDIYVKRLKNLEFLLAVGIEFIPLNSLRNIVNECEFVRACIYELEHCSDLPL